VTFAVRRTFEWRSIRRTNRHMVCLGVGALVGAAVALLTLDPAFLAGTGGKWLRPQDDLVQYVVAWRYFVAEPWRLPLLGLPEAGYPEGASVLFMDALPLGVLGSKLAYRATGVLINPFGWWILLTHVLQGLMAARTMAALGVRSVAASAAAAILTVCCTAFVNRMAHTALSSHFLILWGLALYFEMVRDRRAKPAEVTLLLLVALLVNSYLFAMALLLGCAGYLALWQRRSLCRWDVGRLAAGCALVFVVGVASGYGIMLTRPRTMIGAGLGLYSWNPASLVVRPDGFAGSLGHVTRLATPGQYEGDAYLGLGVLLLLALTVVSAPRRVAVFCARNWPLSAAIVLCALYAASNRIYIGGTMVADIHLPPAIFELGSYFRASGRFVWPLSYTLGLLPLAFVFRRWPGASAIVIAAAASGLQLVDANRILANRAAYARTPYPDLLASTDIASWMSSHRRLWMFPSYSCGGLGPVGRSWGGREANRELQIQDLAASLQRPTNSLYTSRNLKDCAAEASWSRSAVLEPEVLYLISPEAVRAWPALATLAQSPACRALPWALACSLSWGAPPPAADSAGRPEADANPVLPSADARAGTL
jgi:hypothetical protein